MDGEMTDEGTTNSAPKDSVYVRGEWKQPHEMSREETIQHLLFCRLNAEAACEEVRRWEAYLEQRWGDDAGRGSGKESGADQRPKPVRAELAADPAADP